MKIKQSTTIGAALAALLALAIGLPGIHAETKPAQPAPATEAKAKKVDAPSDAKAKKAAAPAEAKAKQATAPTEAKAKKAAAPAETKPKQAAVTEAKSKQSAPPAESKPKPAAPVEAKPKPKPAPVPAAADVKGKQPAEASYTLSEKSNLRESPSRGSYSDVWLARGVKVESYPEKGSFKNGTWRHVIVREGQKHAGSHGWLRRDWLDYKGRGK